MRRGDCCLLKWKDVDLKQRFITLKTAKTGQTVDIPVFPMLREELERVRPMAGDSEFCFPEAAEMYQNNPDGITWRVKQVLARALEPKLAEEGTEPITVPLPEEVRTRGLVFINRLGETDRPGKMRAVFAADTAGQSLDEAIASTGCSRGTGSNYLNELERETGCTIRRGKRRALKADGLQTERQNAKRRASVRDFHSFRVT